MGGKTARAIEGFSQIVEISLGRGGTLEKAINEANRVRLGSYIIGHTDSETDCLGLVAEVNSLFESEEIYGELRRIQNESKSLLKKRRIIDRELEELRAFAEANVPLGGWCIAGRTGGYEEK